MEQEISGISKFPEKRTTSRGEPKFSKRISGKCLFHSILNRDFRKFWSNGTRPKTVEGYALNKGKGVRFCLCLFLWFFFSALFPAIAVKKSARESRNSRHFITQRDNIHTRANDTCVDQRGYMTSGWRNLF